MCGMTAADYTPGDLLQAYSLLQAYPFFWQCVTDSHHCACFPPSLLLLLGPPAAACLCCCCCWLVLLLLSSQHVLFQAEAFKVVSRHHNMIAFAVDLGLLTKALHSESVTRETYIHMHTQLLLMLRSCGHPDKQGQLLGSSRARCYTLNMHLLLACAVLEPAWGFSL